MAKRRKKDKKNDTSKPQKVADVELKTEQGSLKTTTNVFAKGEGMPIEVHTKSGNPIEVNINSKLTTKDIYYTLCQRKNLEVSHSWQYFILLNAFSLLCFTIDIILISKITPTAVFHIKILPFALEGIGIACPILWSYMAKRSNTRYEKYEKAISDIERNVQDNENTSDSNNNPSENFTLGTNIIINKGGKYFIGLWIFIIICHILLLYVFN